LDRKFEPVFTQTIFENFEFFRVLAFRKMFAPTRGASRWSPLLSVCCLLLCACVLCCGVVLCARGCVVPSACDTINESGQRGRGRGRGGASEPHAPPTPTNHPTPRSTSTSTHKHTDTRTHGHTDTRRQTTGLPSLSLSPSPSRLSRVPFSSSRGCSPSPFTSASDVTVAPFCVTIRQHTQYTTHTHTRTNGNADTEDTQTEAHIRTMRVHTMGARGCSSVGNGGLVLPRVGWSRQQQQQCPYLVRVDRPVGMPVEVSRPPARLVPGFRGEGSGAC
jgi:hypothetical protein